MITLRVSLSNDVIILGKNNILRSNCNKHQSDDDFIASKVLKTASDRVENATAKWSYSKEVDSDNYNYEKCELNKEKFKWK